MSDPRIAAFFARANPWQAELLALRAILADTPLSEDFKWRSPVYTFLGGNVATLWGFKDRCVLSFFKGVLLADAEGILIAPGAHSRSVRMIKLDSTADITAREAILRGYIHAAIEVEKSGQRVAMDDTLDLPEELIRKLDDDEIFRAAFDGLTPGRQRGWVLHFSQPRKSATRTSRIEKAAPRILDGKGLHDR